jgi:hypothetical protein
VRSEMRERAEMASVVRSEEAYAGEDQRREWERGNERAHRFRNPLRNLLNRLNERRLQLPIRNTSQDHSPHRRNAPIPRLPIVLRLLPCESGFHRFKLGTKVPLGSDVDGRDIGGGRSVDCGWV